MSFKDKNERLQRSSTLAAGPGGYDPEPRGSGDSGEEREKLAWGGASTDSGPEGPAPCPALGVGWGVPLWALPAGKAAAQSHGDA